MGTTQEGRCTTPGRPPRPDARVSVPSFMVIQIIGGNFIQSNTIGSVMQNHFHVPEFVTGMVLVVLIFTVSAGGFRG